MKTILGIDQIDKIKKACNGKRVGLITNYSGVDSGWCDNIDRLMESGCQLVKIYTPEHGLYGAADGEEVADTVHPKYKTPVISLYGDRKKPTKDDLDGIDLLIYDIQDVGLRYYTFLYTLTYSIEAAAESGISFLVLDRPNPLGGQIVKGGCLHKNQASFVGDYELPLRYGMTCGEVGTYFIRYRNLKMDYQVITMQNYTRDMYFPDTGMIWNVPSPALHTYECTICYAGGCFMEGTNISEGRGSAEPFQMYGAPFIDMDLLYQELRNQITDPKVVFRKRAFVPFASKFKDEVCFGVEFEPLDKTLDFIPIALTFMGIMAKLYPEQFIYNKKDQVNHLSHLTGSNMVEDFLMEKLTLKELLTVWDEEAAQFQKQTKDLYLYQ